MVGVRAARCSSGFVSQRSQKHLSDMITTGPVMSREKGQFSFMTRLLSSTLAAWGDYVINMCDSHNLPARPVPVSPMPVPPSFSSFPPSFSSFPDLGGSSRQEPETSGSVHQGDSRDKGKESDRKKRKRDRRRDKHSNRGRTPSREREREKESSKDNSYTFDDERKKAEEDSARGTREQDILQPVFFSDKKGDPLNVQYGGIYSRDVPKYHLVGCT